LVRAELSAHTQRLQDESSLKCNSYHGIVMQDKIYFCVALFTYHNISSTVETINPASTYRGYVYVYFNATYYAFEMWSLERRADLHLLNTTV